MSIDEFLSRISHSPQHTCFYHFTDRSNLEFIASEHGLLPTGTLREKGIQIPAPGGNDWSMDADRRFGMDQYVHLCFTTGHPMTRPAQEDGRIRNLVWLRIKPEVLKLPGVKITGNVANRADAIIYDNIEEGLTNLDYEVLYTRTNWSDPAINARLQAAEKCEILVPGIVPLNLIYKPDGV